MLEKYKDDLVYVKSTETGKKYPIGIKLEKNAWVKETGWYPDTCVVGLAEGLKKILKETPFELESAECEEKISTLYNWYCKEYYAAEPLKYFDDYSLDEVLKKSNIRVKWNEKFDEIQKAKNKFLNLRIAK